MYYFDEILVFFWLTPLAILHASAEVRIWDFMAALCRNPFNTTIPWSDKPIRCVDNQFNVLIN